MEIWRNSNGKYKDTIDLYDDEGKLLKSDVTLEKISPLVNKGALNVIDLTKRTVAVNFAGIEDALKDRKGRRQDEPDPRPQHELQTVSRTATHSQPRSRKWSRSPTVTTPRSPRSAAAR